MRVEKVPAEFSPQALQLIRKLEEEKQEHFAAGELEGAAARLEWEQMPCKPWLAEREARTFVPLCGAKVTAFFQAVKKILFF